MKDPVLRSQTASEPLTLEQEHEMQQTWLRDDDSKMTIMQFPYNIHSQQILILSEKFQKIFGSLIQLEYYFKPIKQEMIFHMCC